jgi:hypothetical protein
VSPRISLAGVHRLPEHVSAGLALMIGSREADFFHPGLVALPGSGAVLQTPGAAPWGAAPPSGATGGRVVEDVDSDAPASFLHLGRELGGETAQNFAQWLPSVGALHGSNHEGNRAHEVVKDCQGLGNVCRA